MFFLLLRAFSSGCAALTGVEAISNGVPAFRKPKSKNAATTLLLMGTVAVTMLMSIIFLANKVQLKFAEFPAEQLLRDGVPVGPDLRTGDGARVSSPTRSSTTSRPGLYFIAAVTGIILILAANTAFNGFPVLASVLAKDGFLPAPAAHPRRPAGVQQRHPDPRRRRARADHRVRRQGHRADPALHRRGLRLVHAQPDRDDPALEPAAARGRCRANVPRCCAAARSTRSARPCPGWC